MTKYVCRGLISLHVTFHSNRTKWSTNLHVKFCRWVKGKRAFRFNVFLIASRDITTECVMLRFKVWRTHLFTLVSLFPMQVFFMLRKRYLIFLKVKARVRCRGKIKRAKRPWFFPLSIPHLDFTFKKTLKS